MGGNQQQPVLDQSLNGSKPLWQSTTFIGIVIMVIAQVAALFGYQFSQDDVAAVTGNTEQLLAGAMTAFGAIMAIIGRIRATKRIGGTGAAS